MEVVLKKMGDREKLDALQMSSRGAVMFLIALVFIRLSGRRSFGVRYPLARL